METVWRDIGKKKKKSLTALLAPPLDHISLTQQFEPRQRLFALSAPEKLQDPGENGALFGRVSVSSVTAGYSCCATQHCCPVEISVPLCFELVALLLSADLISD